MIRMGMRLTLRGGRDAVVRLIVISLAVAVGVAVMLGVFSLFNAYQSTTDRQCWECSPTTLGAAAGGSAPGPDGSRGRPVGMNADGTVDLAAAQQAGAKELWNFSQDFYQGTELRRLDLAALTADAPTLPGMTTVPGPASGSRTSCISELKAYP